jgi:hypothetical protein
LGCRLVLRWYSGGIVPWLLRNEQGADCGLDRVGKPDDPKGLGIQRHTSPANHRIPQRLDVLEGKKTRGPLHQKSFAFSATIVAWTPPKMNIAPVGAIVMTTLCTSDMVDRLAGEAFGGETRFGDDLLAVLIIRSGNCALEICHIGRGTALFLNHSASRSSLRLPSARWRNVK